VPKAIQVIDPIRCAIYTRKSTEEGLEQQFNTLDAQREAAEAFIKSQSHENWDVVPVRYDDGGFSGGTLERPALKKLLSDIESGKIDCVVVYKVDRLSRSLLDFSRLMETFEKHSVSFVSVTQLINTKHSMGRLMLNVLMSFAQFEREMVSDRTRDKIAAAKRKGLWCGGRPLLGYDVSSDGASITVNDDEAQRVRAIFDLYLEHQSLIRVIGLLDERRWCSKSWTSRHDKMLGGKPFNKSSLFNLLTNPTYIGKIRHHTAIYDGVHEGIVAPEKFEKVQKLLKRNGATGGAEVRNKFGAMLKGILRCKSCGVAMTPSHSTKNQTKRYRYYVCGHVSKRGTQACPTKSVPATEIEQFVTQELKTFCRDPVLIDQICQQALAESTRQLTELESEQRILERDLRTWYLEMQRIAAIPGNESYLADLAERTRLGETRAEELSSQVSILMKQQLNPEDVRSAMQEFEAVWQLLTLVEQRRVVHLMVERVEFDGKLGKVAITYHPLGLKAFADKFAKERVV
jgi:site-specific DNA recombinase